jgi:formate dehydrogenase major subunit
MHKLTRRHFLALSAAGAAGGGLTASGLVSAQATHAMELRKKIGESYTICPYCSCGCGLIIATDEEGHITNSEGDPDHIINRGALDPKSVAIRQLSNSPLRLHNVSYRARGSSVWEEKSWDWAVSEIAQRIKKTRDESWVASVNIDGEDVPVNRTEGIAWLGGAANNNEECYLSAKLARSLGVVYLEHQARI